MSSHCVANISFERSVLAASQKNLPLIGRSSPRRLKSHPVTQLLRCRNLKWPSRRCCINHLLPVQFSPSRVARVSFDRSVLDVSNESLLIGHFLPCRMHLLWLVNSRCIAVISFHRSILAISLEHFLIGQLSPCRKNLFWCVSLRYVARIACWRHRSSLSHPRRHRTSWQWFICKTYLSNIYSGTRAFHLPSLSPLLIFAWCSPWWQPPKTSGEGEVSAMGAFLTDWALYPRSFEQ